MLPFRGIPGSSSPLELARLIRDPTGFFHERFDRYGRVWQTRFVYPIVFVIGADANKTLMVTRRSEFSMGLGYQETAVKRVFEGSIMLQDGEAHRQTRDILSPAVGRLALAECAASVGTIWADAVERFACGGPHDAYHVAQTTTFDVAANVLTGLELGAETDRFRPHFERLHDGILAPIPYRVPGSKLDRALRARKKLFQLMRPRIHDARTRAPVGLVGQLAHFQTQAGRFLPVDEIIGQLLLLFWAGYDTTASAASWILHVLARRPDWQDRVAAELDAAGAFDLEGGGLDALVSGRGLDDTGHLLLELERLYPSALFFPRVATEDLEYAGHLLPKGTPVFYSPYMTHRDPALFDRPHAFDPDRWEKSNPDRPRLSTLVGFGGGPRICLGKSFAKMQLRLMLATLLRRYRLEPVPSARTRVQGIPVHHPVDSPLLLRRASRPRARHGKSGVLKAG